MQSDVSKAGREINLSDEVDMDIDNHEFGPIKSVPVENMRAKIENFLSIDN